MLKKSSSVSRHSCLIVWLSLVLIPLFILPGCKSKNEEKVGEQHSTKASSSAFDLKGSLIAMLPPNTLGFFEWNATGKAYERFTTSPWASELFPMKSFASQAADAPRMITILEKAGIDPYQRATWEQLFSRAVIFSTPAKLGSENTPADNAPLTFSIYFESDKKVDLTQKLTSVRNELQNGGILTEEETLQGGKAYKVNTDQFRLQSASAAQPKSNPLILSIGWKGSRGMISTSSWLVQAVLGTGFNALPAIVEKTQFVKSTQGFPDYKETIGFAYFDISETLKHLPKLPAQGGTSNAEMITSTPFTSFSFVSSMTDVPNSYGRLFYEPLTDQHKQWFGAIHASASEALLPAIPSNPLIFFSIDGKTIEEFKELALGEQAKANPELKKQLEAFAGLKRVGIAARVAGVGQSILPIPDVVVLIETDNPKAVKEGLINVITTVSASSAQEMPMTWSDRTIENVPVKAMISPIGVGVFLTEQKNLVIVTSSEPQLQALLRNIAQKPNSELPGSVQQVLTTEPNVGNLLISFQQVGAFMENMGGLLSMYAPQSEGGKTLLSPESIEKVKKMGMMVGSVTVEKDSIGFKSFYQADQKKAG